MAIEAAAAEAAAGAAEAGAVDAGLAGAAGSSLPTLGSAGSLGGALDAIQSAQNMMSMQGVTNMLAKDTPYAADVKTLNNMISKMQSGSSSLLTPSSAKASLTKYSPGQSVVTRRKI